MATTKKIDKEAYDKIVNAFSVLGGPVFGRAASMTGLSIETIKRAWSRGWPDRGFPPISDSGEGPAKESDPAERQLDTPRQPPASLAKGVPFSTAVDTIQGEMGGSLLAEHRVINLGINAAEGAIVSIVTMLGAYQKVLKGMEAQVTKDNEDGMHRGTPAAIIKALNKIMVMLPKTVAASKALMEMRRLNMGMPQTISEQRTTSDDDGVRAQRIAELFRQALPGARRGTVIDVEATTYQGEES